MRLLCFSLVFVGVIMGILLEIVIFLFVGRFLRCFGMLFYEVFVVIVYYKVFSVGLFDDVNRCRYFDVSIWEVKFKIVVDGSVGMVDGMSCECLVFVSVSMIVFLND